MEDNKILNKRIEDNKAEEKRNQIIFQSIAFYLDNNIYAMDVMHIRDIQFAKKIYHVPNTNEKLLGVLNLRGNILPVYSLKQVMGIPDPLKGKDFINDEDKFIIMIKKDKDNFGVFIDSIYRNLAATTENYRTSSLIGKWSNNVLFDGVILDDSKEILVINIDNLLKYIISLK